MSSKSNCFLIVHHDLLIGQALTDSVARRSGLAACEPVTTSVDAFAQVQKEAPVALLVAWERSAPDAAALIHRVLALPTPPRVIVFGVPDGDPVVPPKCCAIKQSEGMPLLLQHLAAATASPGLPAAETPSTAAEAGIDGLAGFTTRQAQVYELLSRGYSNKQIAATLGISLYTAKNHVHVVLSKSGAENRYSLPRSAVPAPNRSFVDAPVSRNGAS
jgi:DNA-binding CsgD family transcriptional regulator